MKKAIVSLLSIPLLLGGCYGAFITTDTARNVFNNIKEKVAEPEYDPLVKRFTYIEKKTSMAQETYTKAVFDADQYFYNTYTITADTDSSEKWVYRYVDEEIIYLVRYERLNGKESLKDPIKCTTEEEFQTKWQEYALDPVVEKLEFNLQSALSRFEIIFNEIDSPDAKITVSFMSSDERSLYADARSTAKEGDKSYQRNARVNIDDLHLASYELTETTSESTLSQLYSYEINKAFITYPSISL